MVRPISVYCSRKNAVDINHQNKIYREHSETANLYQGYEKIVDEN